MRAKQWTPEHEVNWETTDIDTWSSREIISYRIQEVSKVGEVLKKAAPALETAAEVIVERVRQGGRVITVGAGGSGVAGMSVMRELPQNHRDVDPSQFTYRVAGGARILEALGCEELEDSWEEGWQEIDRLAVTYQDVVICISATGRTPYTRGAAERSREEGAYVIGLISAPQSELEDEVDLPLVLDAGPEMFVGATCEKAATSQKAALDAIMDTVVVKLGLIQGNRCRARLCHQKARLREEFFRRDFVMTFGD
jgi:N-acetylmuramic acid 6-phosphate etherase